MRKRKRSHEKEKKCILRFIRGRIKVHLHKEKANFFSDLILGQNTLNREILNDRFLRPGFSEDNNINNNNNI